jgi:hypothetical protein
MEFMGRGELHAVVAAKGKDVGKAPSRFHQSLAHFNNGEGLPRLDQVLPSLFEIVAANRLFPLEASQGSCHCFGPTDPAHPDGISSGADLPQLI